MSINNILMKNIVLPSSDLFLGQSISKDLHFLMKSQWWTREKIDEFQNYNLRKLIKHSFENVPYYSELFKKLKLKPDDIKSKNDLFKLPILTKQEVRKNFPDKIAARNLAKLKYIKNSSSGTTGLSLQYFITKNALSFSRASAIRSWYWMGYRLGDRYIKLSTNSRDARVKKMQDFVNRSKFIFAEHLHEENLIEIIEKIESFNPRFIRCYPFLLYLLSKMIEKRGGIKLKNLKAISTTANTLHPFARIEIERVFNVKIYDSYSCEGGSIFAQCESLDNYHPAEEYAISEFIEDDFSKNDSDSAKRHITTDLFNYATPLIRYDTQDYIVLGQNNKCKCGRNYLNISKIRGRDGDILIMPNGKYMIVENFLLYFVKDRPLQDPIKQFQIYQEKINLIHMRLVVNDLFSEKDKKEIFDYWKSHFDKENVEFVLDIVDKIELSPTGKHRITIRNPEIKIVV